MNTDSWPRKRAGTKAWFPQCHNHKKNVATVSASPVYLTGIGLLRHEGARRLSMFEGTLRLYVADQREGGFLGGLRSFSPHP